MAEKAFRTDATRAAFGLGNVIDNVVKGGEVAARQAAIESKGIDKDSRVRYQNEEWTVAHIHPRFHDLTLRHDDPEVKDKYADPRNVTVI
jgi:hypothetical protein